MNYGTPWTRLRRAIGVALLIAAGPAVAASFGVLPPAPAAGDPGDTAVLADNFAPGSAALVPLMAADVPAQGMTAIDTSRAAAGGESAGKPVDDLAFVRQATEGGRHEIAAAREALPQLQQPELKRIAEMLVTDHSAATEKLARIAEAKSWPLPEPKAHDAPPAGTASSDFDAKWTADMIAGHERSVALYRAEAANGEDKDLRNYARETLPVIERHLAALRDLQK